MKYVVNRILYHAVSIYFFINLEYEKFVIRKSGKLYRIIEGDWKMKSKTILSADEMLEILSSQWATIQDIMKIGSVGRNKARDIKNKRIFHTWSVRWKWQYSNTRMY